MRWQAVLQEFLGPNKTLDRHLDADESVALGASWLAANLSDGFKLNRKIGMVDGMPYGVLYRVRPLPGAAKETSVEGAEEALFPRLKKFPLKARPCLAAWLPVWKGFCVRWGLGPRFTACLVCSLPASVPDSCDAPSL